MDYIKIIMPIAVIISLFVLFIYIAINDKKWKKQANDEQAQIEERQQNPIREETKATVVSKRILDSYEGILVSRYVLDFLVAFQIENETIEFSVTKEFFDSITENDQGILITINGELYDFKKSLSK